MTEAEFRQRRRQKFLTEKYFLLNANAIAFLKSEAVRAIAEKGVDFDSFREGNVFQKSLQLLRLHYTAGEPVESLKPLYADALRWFGEWHKAEHEYWGHRIQETGNTDLDADISPLEFGDLGHFQLALDMVSLGILLGEGDAVRQAAVWMQSTRGSDMLMEYLLETIVPDPRDIEKFWHVKPYDPLLDAIYTADTPEESAAYVKKYLDGWYKAFEGVPWHDGHLVQTEEYSAYEGYWSFEAAAVCVLHGIDDSSFRDHLVYPKDLADWARAHHVKAKVKLSATTTAAAEERLRCEAGQPCPKTGFWFTPARAGSCQRFEAGQVMPEVGGDYGATIWQWDDRQG